MSKKLNLRGKDASMLRVLQELCILFEVNNENLSSSDG